MEEKDCCYNCNGSGKVRRNFTNPEGKYTFHKEVCHVCDGSGDFVEETEDDEDENEE